MTRKPHRHGREILREPLLNKGTAFSPEEKEAFGLYGLLPSNTESIEEQLLRCRSAYSVKDNPMEQHIYLRSLQDRNEVLFYRFVLDNLVEMMPIIYTPTVGEACQYFHNIYRQPRGLFINYGERNKMDSILASIAQKRDVRVIVVTDGERILGLGDQGAGGLGIPIGKLSLYTVCGGINPAQTLPIILDVGTNNQEKLQDPEYLGWHHSRIVDDEYYDFVDQFVQGVKKHFPNTLLQFEDFAQVHAYPLLEKYQDQLCTFNDDIQGTAAVAVAALIAATKVSKKPLKEHRIAVLGAGSAGCGISQQIVQAMIQQGLNEKEARSRFYLVDIMGLLQNNMSGLKEFQKPFAHDPQNLKDWKLQDPNKIGLLDVMQNAKPSILLGVSGQPHQFTEDIVKIMASTCEHPIIFPLSNPTSRCEGIPADLLKWTNGKALVATGSPFNAVEIGSQSIAIAQCNNSYIFPGVGLAVVASNAKRVTNSMMMAAALALSELAPAMSSSEGALLPDLETIRQVSKHIAKAVIQQGIKEDHVEQLSESEIDELLTLTMWHPTYKKLID